MLEPLETKAHQTIAMRQNQGFYFPPANLIHEFLEDFAFEVQTASDLFQKLYIRQAFRHDKLFQHSPLVGKIGLLRRAGNAAVRYQAGRQTLPDALKFAQLSFGITPSVPVRTRCRDQAPLAFPTLQSLDCHSKEFRRLASAHSAFHDHYYTYLIIQINTRDWLPQLEWKLD
jgi:hypothetical protein